jgi:tRNA(Ile)-lysidine synthase
METDRAVAQLDRQVKRALQEWGLTGGALLVVAVSGGADSLALLFALCHLKRELGLELHGAHLDHGLRGDASEADARFVAETFRRLGIDLTSERADVPAFRKSHRLSLEAAAREVRYDFLARVAGEQRAGAIALGHTSDDQAETVLMHIIRGSGLTGLRGMEPSTVRNINGMEVRLVRPLLRSSRADTVDYCRALGLKPRLDESNLSKEQSRNRIRIELLPLLERYNPAVRDALIRLSRITAKEVDYLNGRLDGVWHDAVREEGGYVALRKDVFNRLEPALQAHLLRRAVVRVKGDLNEIKQIHVDDMARLMDGPAGRALHLPGGLRFSVGYAEATVALIESDLCPLPPLDGEQQLNIPGETLVRGWRVTATLMARSPAETFGRPSRDGEPLPQQHRSGGEEETTGIDPASGYRPAELTAHLRYEAVGDRLSLRARRPGDRFQPLGMSGQKKLQDFMVDARIPRQWRDRVPLVISPRGIAWVAGWRIADWARVGKEDEVRLELRLEPEAEYRASAQPGAN